MKKFGVTVFSVMLAAVLIASGLNLSPVGAQPAIQQPGGDEARRTISVTGTGSVSAQPDTAYIVVGVRTEAETASAALNQNSQQVTQLINALRQAGIAQNDIQTQYVNLSPRYADQPNQAGQPQVTGYVATNTVQARVPDISDVGQILDTAVEEGGNLIENIRFEVSDQQEAQQQAREEAFASARQKAEQLARLAGAQLGQVLSLSETTSFPRPFGAGGASLQAEQAVPIEPGMQNVQVDLQVTWEITGGAQAGAGTTATPVILQTGQATAIPAATETPVLSGTQRSAITAQAPAVPTITLEVGENAAEQLRDLGATVQVQNTIQQPFFAVMGRVLNVNGQEVQVFEFDNEADADQAAGAISETGEQVGDLPGNFLGAAHFYQEANMIILYVGSDEDTLDLLALAFGAPLTREEQ